MNETNNALANITDAGLFERLASDVLRFSDSEIYKSISHQGMNPQGKTIKAPLDNLGWCLVDGEDKVVAVAHTTTSRNDLEVKWLRDLDTVTPRKKGGKPTGSDGDLVKAIKELDKIRQKNPELKARLALMCNSDEPQDIRIKAQQLASQHNIELEIWSNSRISSFLDIDPNGQTIRHKYFGVLPTVLSYEELLRIGNLSTVHLNFNTKLFVERGDIQFQNLNLVVGTSGSGKTTICTNYILKKIDQYHPVLVLREENIQSSINLDEAIEKELRRYSDRLINGCGKKALELCSLENPLIILIEDINNINNTEQLIEKICAWVINEKRINILCPIWYQKLSTLSFKLKEKLSKNGFSFIYVDNYSDEQALEALQKSSRLNNKNIDDLTLIQIAKNLGNDPLLLDLITNHTEVSKKDHILEDFIKNTLEQIPYQKDKFIDDLEKTLLKSISYFIFNKTNRVNISDLSAFLNREEKADIINIVADGGIIRLDEQSNIIFRHDKIKFFLMAQSIQKFLEKDEYLEVLTDPYFSEIIGLSCYLSSLEIERLEVFTQYNFLIGIYAYYYAVKNNSDYIHTCVTSISNWLTDKDNHKFSKISLRFKSLTVLNELVHNSIPDLLKLYPKQDHQHIYFECGFKNGNLANGIQWIRFFPFEVNYSQISLVIDFVVKKYKNGLKNKLFEILKDKNTKISILHSLFIIIGYIGDAEYLDSVSTAINNIQDEEKDYLLIFWVLSRICDEESVYLLDIVLNYWNTLSEDQDQYQRSPKSSFTMYTLDFKFRNYLPTDSTINYLLNFANKSELKNYVLYLLRLVDHPDVLEAQVKKLADWDRRGFHTWGQIADDVSRAFKDGQLLSKPSKDRLKEIFINNQNDSCARKHALAIWISSPSEGDLPTLQTISSEDEIYDKVLMAKAKYRDLSIVDQLIDKIKSNDSTYWWQATRYMWHDKFEQIFEDHMLTINDDNYWMLFEIFEKFSIEKAETLLEKHWDKLNQYNIFIQLALLVGTDKLCSLVHNSIQMRNLQEVFKYFNHHWGFKTEGRKGIYRDQQILAIKPYIQYFDDLAKMNLYQICLKSGWKNFAQEIIEPLIAEDSQYSLKITTKRLSEELQEGKIIWSDRWLHDCVDQGWSIVEAFEVLISWLDTNYCDFAVDIVVSNLEYTGLRQHFLRLNDLCEIKGVNQHIQEILERTYWAIYLRTIE